MEEVLKELEGCTDPVHGCKKVCTGFTVEQGSGSLVFSVCIWGVGYLPAGSTGGLWMRTRVGRRGGFRGRGAGGVVPLACLLLLLF